MVSPEKTKHPEPANDGDESPWDSSEADDQTNKPTAASFQPGLKTATSPAGVRTCVRDTRALAAAFVDHEALGSQSRQVLIIPLTNKSNYRSQRIYASRSVIQLFSFLGI